MSENADQHAVQPDQKQQSLLQLFTLQRRKSEAHIVTRLDRLQEFYQKVTLQRQAAEIELLRSQLKAEELKRSSNVDDKEQPADCRTGNNESEHLESKVSALEQVLESCQK